MVRQAAPKRAPVKPEPVDAARLATPRLPRRAPGKLRFELLVDAVDRLLAEHDASVISIQDIAEAADVPAPSIYHFFPSTAAAFVALAQRYLSVFQAMYSEPLNHTALVGWEDIFRAKGGAAVDYFNTNIVSRKLFLGSDYSWQVRLADIQSNRTLATHIVGDYDRHFIVADREALVDKVEIAIGIGDSVWSFSYLHHGYVTDTYREEAFHAFHAYLRGYIPEYARKRSEARAG
ncbi:MAG: hypothetical protein DI533_22260 [Cereibacter sphaeroides]|uniref:HTH tetR-type domain-containing protein n=1 Tax=Cereibacter sphaeroides TaxID=1063 RepID=A0A2W5TFM3_CERSP|nr:MAG: hypothetical protein DI533_22260 [Cereibacter sphaeroides]